MIHIVLFEPEIPPNTGNIIRLTANTGFHLNLIEPLGFDLDHKQLRRAGLDYHEWAAIDCYRDYDDFLNNCQFNNLYAFTTKAEKIYSSAEFRPGDALLFGPESRGWRYVDSASRRDGRPGRGERLREEPHRAGHGTPSPVASRPL